MDTRLTQAQLSQVIAEIDRLSQLRDNELDREQVKQILQELNLPDDLLDDAIVQLRRREALAQQNQRHKIVISTIAIMIVGLIATVAVVQQKQHNKIARIAAIQDIVTLKDSTNSVTQFDRTKDAQVFYRVTLKNPPINDRLAVSCDWLDSTGERIHQSRFQTQEITRSPWTTFCFAPLSPQSKPGNWTVKMSIAERPISEETFVVK
ncbi:MULTISPECIES: DUF3859 domain-containing protein [Leptolyngbya]|uniref:DUF3859 domain-containing protein n=1 Tax=Leptolyngbya TaxID=47251 RepID=UPI00168670B0|nr:DUF3859 domain-containing protein [Leptolyngbya sp. FACHB-1624]MBD1858201.1 DUF3859 domain-containing protein [Leptolyngbya sp. FACHB-1624]